MIDFFSLCVHCGEPEEDHLANKCDLFAPTRYERPQEVTLMATDTQGVVEMRLWGQSGGYAMDLPRSILTAMVEPFLG